MPNYNFHKKVGMYSSFLVSVILIFILGFKVTMEWYHWLLSLLVIILYSNMPDIDHHIGKLRRYVFQIIFGMLVLSVFMFVFLGPVKTIATYMIIGVAGLAVFKMKHRGPMHTYLFGLIISLPLLFIKPLVFVIGLTSIFAHIFVDRLYSKLRKKIKKMLGIRSVNKIYINKKKVIEV